MVYTFTITTDADGDCLMTAAANNKNIANADQADSDRIGDACDP